MTDQSMKEISKRELTTEIDKLKSTLDATAKKAGEDAAKSKLEAETKKHVTDAWNDLMKKAKADFEKATSEIATKEKKDFAKETEDIVPPVNAGRRTWFF